MQVADVIAQILKREEVEVLLAYPRNPIIEAAARADIRTIIVWQERTGLHMADAVSRLSSGNRFGVFAMQNGPGTENSLGAVAQAYADSVPILVLPAGYPRNLTNVPPNFSALQSFRPISKWCDQLTRPADVCEVLRRAFSQLRNGRRGPVVVEVPLHVVVEEVEAPTLYEPGPTARSGPDPASVSKAVDALLAAKRPLLYAGQGVHYVRAWEALRELAELLQIPVATSLQGKSVFP